MSEDLTLISIPNFMPDYEEVPYGYSSGTKKRENLIAKLDETSHGYCMYCYSRIRIDKKLYYHIEHGIEKANDDNDKLRNCVMNMAIACPICNNRFKKVCEKERIEFISGTEEYTKFFEGNCCAPNCRQMCSELIELRKKVNENVFGHIVFQPLSSNYPSNIHPSTKRPLHIQYDILLGKFIPSAMNLKSESEKDFLYDHINYFHLNDLQYRTDELYNFCKDVIDNELTSFPKGRYNNYIVDLFIDKIIVLELEEIYRICRLVYLLGLLSGRIV